MSEKKIEMRRRTADMLDLPASERQMYYAIPAADEDQLA